MSDAAVPVGRCIGCFHDFSTGPCGGCGAEQEFASASYAWKARDRLDHDAGHPSGYDCDGYAIMSPSEACGHSFPVR